MVKETIRRKGVLTIVHTVTESLHLVLVDVVRLQLAVELGLLAHHLGQNLLVLLALLDAGRLVLAIEVVRDDHR